MEYGWQQTAILDDMIIYRSNPAQALLREREALESRSNLSLLDLMKCVVTTDRCDTKDITDIAQFLSVSLLQNVNKQLICGMQR